MHENPFAGLLLWEIGVGVVLCFLAIVTVTGFFVALWSGWHVLAERYRCKREFTGERWRFQSGRMRGGCGYNNCLTLGANAEGLYMSAIVPWHPPLFIPWIEITAREERRWWGMGTVFTLGQETQIPLWLFKGMGEKLLAQGPGGQTDAFRASFPVSSG